MIVIEAIQSSAFLVVFVLPRRDHIIETFLFVLHHRDALSSVLFHSLKDQEVRVLNVQSGRKRRAFVHTNEVVGAARETIQRSP